MLTKIILIVLCLISIPIALMLGALLHNDLPWNDPPGCMQRLRHYLSTNVAETVDESNYPELVIRQFPYPADRFFLLLSTSVTTLGWEITSQNDQSHTLNAVVTSSLIGYKDDVTIKLIPVTESSISLYIRSSSRTGTGDFGTNTRHILDLYQQIDGFVEK